MSWATLLLGLFLATPAAAQEKPELAKVRLAVGGQAALYYLPLVVTQRLGLFREAGVEVDISDFAGGSRALQALVGGSADVVTGAFDHTIQMQAKNQPVVALVELGQFPGFVLALLNAKAAAYRSPADLKGMKIGVTAPGSSTHFMALQLMAKSGLKPDDASFLGVGATTTAVAAVKRGEIDAIVNTDPAVALLQREGLIKIVADTRTRDGTREVYGGIYPAAVMYASPAFIDKNPHTVQALVNAFVRGLAFMRSHSPEEVAAVVPEEYALGDKPLYVQAIKNSLPMFSPDGRFAREGAETAHSVLKAFDPDVRNAKIDLAATYTDRFVEKAPPVK
ncbi:MAG: ABC transporter substrate-binding protein [Xanthobacteraceae bacterium]